MPVRTEVLSPSAKSGLATKRRRDAGRNGLLDGGPHLVGHVAQHDHDLDGLRGKRRLHGMHDQRLPLGLGQHLVGAAHARRAAGREHQHGDARRLPAGPPPRRRCRRAAAGGWRSRPSSPPAPMRTISARPTGRPAASRSSTMSKPLYLGDLAQPGRPSTGLPSSSPVSSRLPGSTGMPKWMTSPPASSMPAGTTSWRSTIAEAPAIRKMSQPSPLQFLQRAGDGLGVMGDAALADQRAAERGQSLGRGADRLVQHLVARAGQPGLHQAGAHRLERRDGDQRLVGRLRDFDGARPRLCEARRKG